MALRPSRIVEPGGALPESALLAGEWFALERHPNILIVGPDGLVAAALRKLWASLRQPVVSVTWPNYPLPVDSRAGTLLVRDLELLPGEDQHRLQEWLDQPGRSVQVVATSSASVFQRVAQGTFLSSLYYRLNTLYFEIEG
jgi:hypothetical protein